MIRLAHQALDVCPVAFGCEALGGYNWGQVDIAEVEGAVAEAAEVGGVLFDTADTYGPHLSEERLGRLIAPFRDRVVLATKFGVRLGPKGAWYDNSPAWIDAALEGSLTRLGLETIDLYQMHWPDGTTPLEAVFARLETHRAAGKIRAYGLSNVPAAALLALNPGDWPGLASFSLSFSLLERDARAEIRALQGRGVQFIAYGALAQGLLSGKYDADSAFGPDDRRANPKYAHFHGARLRENLKVVDRLKARAAQSGHAPVALALAAVLQDLPGALVLAGTKSRAQWAGSLAALEVPTAALEGLL